LILQAPTFAALAVGEIAAVPTLPGATTEIGARVLLQDFPNASPGYVLMAVPSSNGIGHRYARPAAIGRERRRLIPSSEALCRPGPAAEVADTAVGKAGDKHELEQHLTPSVNRL
jgi:hypothetical protein